MSPIVCLLNFVLSLAAWLPWKWPAVEAGDFLIVGTLVVLEGLLSADNALVLALLVRHLPDDQQKKALLYGLVGAFVLRGTGIFFAKMIMSLWWLCGIGSLYLMGLAAKHFLQRDNHHNDDPSNAEKATKRGLGFWQTVAMVELTDIFFAIDSILVAVALVHNPSKIWIVYAGGFLGIILLRLAASFFIGLIRKYPALDNVAYALVGWAGVKLASASADIFHEEHKQPEPHYLPTWGFWVGFALILTVGITIAVRHKRSARDEADQARADEDLDCLEEGGFVAEMPPPPGPRPKKG